MGVDPNEVRGDADEAGLPGHEQDEYRRRDVSTAPEADPAEDAGLPDHERDDVRGGDTGSAETNP